MNLQMEIKQNEETAFNIRTDQTVTRLHWLLPEKFSILFENIYILNCNIKFTNIHK